jgi:hypothetical protein
MGQWQTAKDELRALLNDLPNDRYCYRKKIFGLINGENKSFKTFEFRRTTNFADADISAAPLGVYLGGVRLESDAIELDDLITGELTLAEAPIDEGKELTATYYYQWFLDEELSDFLTAASRWLLLGSDYTSIPDGRSQAALYFAAKDALRKMAMRFALRASNTFLLEDLPKKESLEISKVYAEMAGVYEKSASKYRDDYYKKSGQSLAAFSLSNWGAAGDVTPRR